MIRVPIAFAFAFLWSIGFAAHADQICPPIDFELACTDEIDCAPIALNCASIALHQEPAQKWTPERKDKATKTLYLAQDHYTQGSFLSSAELLVKVLSDDYLNQEQRKLGQRVLGHALLEYALESKDPKHRTSVADKLWAAYVSYRAAEQLGDRTAELYTGLAEAQLNLGAFEAAIRDGITAATIDANHSPAHLVRGHAHLNNAYAQSQPTEPSEQSGEAENDGPTVDPAKEYARAVLAYQSAFDIGRDLTLGQKIAGNIGLCLAMAHMPQPDLSRPRQSVATAQKKIEHAQKWVGFAAFEISKARDILKSEQCTFDCIDPEKLNYESGRLNGARSSVEKAEASVQQAEEILADLSQPAAQYCQLAEDLAGGPTTSTRLAFGQLSEQEGAYSSAIDAYLKAWQTERYCDACRAGLRRTGYLSTY